MLGRFKHGVPKFNQSSPYQAAPRKFGPNSDEAIPEDESPTLDENRKKVVQQVIGTCLYYARTVDCTILPEISSIASKQSKSTEKKQKEKSNNY